MRIFALPLLKRMNFRHIALLTLVVVVAPFTGSTQIVNQSDRALQVQLNTITTAVPFLMIAPDSRSGAMGDAGVAISPDANSVHWNSAKLGFLEQDIEASLSYSPWLRALVNDMSLAYLSGYKKISKTQGIGGSLRYFTLGEITFTDDNGSIIRPFKPAEFALDIGFGQRLSERFSGGIAARFINSNLTGGVNVAGADSRPGRSFAVDLSAFYTNDDVKVGGKDAIFNWGVNISNIGAKMRYTNTDRRDFIPTNLKLGAALTLELDDYNDLTITTDFNKLLVPTPPIYNAEGDSILSGRDPDVGTATGIVQSFYDAPGQFDPETNSIVSGSILGEELREVNISAGLEYWYDKQFAFRSGYFFEHLTKGNRQFITIGAALRYQVMTIDISYLISTTQNNPLANTLRFSLRFGLGGKASGGENATPSE
jgi:hypothetical protein